MKSSLFVPVLIAASSTLGGCASFFNTADSSDFSCPGMPKGVMCTTPATVYEMTNGDGVKAIRGAPDAPQTQQQPAASAPATALAKGSVDALVQGALLKPKYAEPQTPQPLREPARVMRIWVKPWIDVNDDLHWPSYVYTEVVPRKWTVGKKEFAAMRALNVPHFSASPEPAQPAQPTQAKDPKSSTGKPATLPAVDSIPLN